MKLAIGLVLAAPVVIQQVWWFVSPGLHAHERRFMLPLIVATVFFFALGVAAAIFALPLYLKVLTALATILLVMTVVTGFFGQNFVAFIPYDSAVAFWGSISFMVIAALSLAVYFRRKGWL